MAKTEPKNDLRSQLRATPIKQLKKAVDDDNSMIGASNNEFLNLEDGKAVKIRLFPAHPGHENFYVAKKSYWLSVAKDGGDLGRTTVPDSKLHGGTKFDIVEEYTKMAKKTWAGDTEKIEAISGDKNSLKPAYSWLSYASIVTPENPLHPMLWEFKKMVRDAMNKLAFNEDDDDAIEVDPFTDPDEGLPILVKYMKNPNKKKGENYYETLFPKKVSARPLSDEEIDAFMKLKPLDELVMGYTMKDFDRALEGLQNFDEENEIGLFDDDEWLEKVEEIKAQYDAADDEDDKPAKKKTAAKPVKKEEPKKLAKPTKKAPEPEPEEEEEEAEETEDDGFDDMDRSELKNYIKENELPVTVKKIWTDDDLRAEIRAAVAAAAEPEEEVEEEVEEEAEEEDDDKPAAKVSLADIRSKLANKKK